MSKIINTGDIYETVVEYVKGDHTITVSSTDKAWINKILKLCAENPEETRIVAQNPDGSVCAKLPKKYLKLSKPRKVTLSEEQKAAAAERLCASRKRASGK